MSLALRDSSVLHGAMSNTTTESGTSERYAWYVVGVLMFVYIVSFIDRLILSLLVQPIKQDLGVSDTQIGLLAGIGFALFYCIMGVPLARLVDRSNRKWLIIAGIALWTAMTAASAFATSFGGLLLARIGVGIGEATLTPAAASMIADYFARDRVAKALGTYSVGLYLGSGVALLAGGLVVQSVTSSGPVQIAGLGSFNAWQLAFLVAALPGIAAVLIMLTVREPARREFAGNARTADAGKAVPASEVIAFLRQHRRLLAAHFVGYGAIGTVVTAYLVWAPEVLRRTFDITAGQAGLVYGSLLVSLGAVGPYLGGLWAQRAAAKGHADAEMRVSIITCCLLTPAIAVAPLMPSLTLATVLLAPVVLLLAVPQGLAPTVLQLITPNGMRGQVLSVFVLLAVIFAYTVGPTAVPLCAKWVFGSEQALNRGLALVSAILIPIAAIALASGRKQYRELMIERGRAS